MNAAERRTATLAILLLLLGWGARALPPSLCENCGDLSAIQVVEASSQQGLTPQMAAPEQKGFKPEKKASGKSKQASGPVSVNRASVQELQKVKGIGPVMAQRIVEFRQKNGPFRGAKDLDKVQGIGQKKLDNLLPFLIFD